jgi:hypothetical protein
VRPLRSVLAAEVGRRAIMPRTVRWATRSGAEYGRSVHGTAMSLRPGRLGLSEATSHSNNRPGCARVRSRVSAGDPYTSRLTSAASRVLAVKWFDRASSI